MKIVTLEDICEIIAGQSPPSSTYNKAGDGLPFFQGKADFGKLHPKTRIWCNQPRKVAEKGDILMSVRAPVGPTNVCDQKCCIGRGLSAIRPGKDIDQQYLLFYLRKVELEISNKGRGSTFSAITQKDLKGIKIPLPPLEEQKRIVHILDQADSLRQKRQKAISLLDDYLKAVFLEMFGDPVTNPKGWEVQLLGDISKKITDGTHKTPKYQTDGVKFISAKNVKDEKIDWDDIKYISQEEHTSIYKRCNAEQGDILLTKSGSLGMAALVDVDFEFSLFESLALIKINRDILEPIYLREYLNLNAVKRFYSERTKGVGVKHLHLIDIKSLPVIIPPIEIQKQFIDIVKAIQATKQLMFGQADEMKNNFNSIMQKAFAN